MALTPNQRIAKLRERGIKQVLIARYFGHKNISTVNNVIHERNKTGEQTKKVRAFIAKLLELPHKDVWGNTDD